MANVSVRPIDKHMRVYYNGERVSLVLFVFARVRGELILLVFAFWIVKLPLEPCVTAPTLFGKRNFTGESV